jgi:hypothetical protein
MPWEPEQFDGETTPSWLKSSWAKEVAEKAGTLPGWADPATLPHLIVEQRRLTDEQVRTVLSALCESTPTQPHPLIKQLRKNALATSLDEFAWRLFETWEAHRAPADHQWALAAVGLLGFDTAAAKLSPRIRSWADGKKKLAKFALECLGAIRTDGALMQLDSLSRSAQAKWVQSTARDILRDAAIDRGISLADLEDNAIPDCGLDARGTRVFEYTGRSFQFVLGPGLKPLLKDDAGKTAGSFPKAKKTDDQALAAQLKAEWESLKNQVTQVAKLQASRLKKSLVAARRWRADSFLRLSAHPLLRHLIRGAVWGQYDLCDYPPGWGAGRLKCAFRVTEEGDLADVNDAAMTINEDDHLRIGLVHPIHLDQAQRGLWGQLLSDYELLAPFPQLTRPIYSLTQAELNQTELTRFAESPIPYTVLFAIIGNMGWAPLPASAEERGFSRTIADVTVIMKYDEVAVWSSSAIKSCRFLHSPGVNDDAPAVMLTLGQIDPAIVSEVIRDVTSVIEAASKHKQ